jgi:hypothetical protein
MCTTPCTKTWTTGITPSDCSSPCSPLPLPLSWLARRSNSPPRRSLLVWSVGSTVAKLRAINAIRRYFLDLDPHKAKYFSLPVSDSGPLFSAIPERASLFFTMFMSGLFAAVSCACWLIAATVWVWYAVVVAVLAAVGVWSALVSYIRYCQRHIDSETTSTSRLPTEVSLADNTGAD